MENLTLIALAVLAIINFILYHKIFDVYYLGDLGHSLFKEIIGCLIAAAFELALIIWIGGFVLKALIFIVLIIFIICIIKNVKSGKAQMNGWTITKLVICGLGLLIMLIPGLFDGVADSMKNSKEKEVVKDYGDEKIDTDDNEQVYIVNETKNEEKIDAFYNRNDYIYGLIETYGYTENEFGYYPNEEEYVFVSENNYDIDYIYIGNQTAEKYCFYGISIGENISDVHNILNEDFTFVATCELESNSNIMQNIYIVSGGGMLLINYDVENKIITEILYSKEVTPDNIPAKMTEATVWAVLCKNFGKGIDTYEFSINELGNNVNITVDFETFYDGVIYVSRDIVLADGSIQNEKNNYSFNYSSDGSVRVLEENFEKNIEFDYQDGFVLRIIDTNTNNVEEYFENHKSEDIEINANEAISQENRRDYSFYMLDAKSKTTISLLFDSIDFEYGTIELLREIYEGEGGYERRSGCFERVESNGYIYFDVYENFEYVELLKMYRQDPEQYYGLDTVPVPTMRFTFDYQNGYILTVSDLQMDTVEEYNHSPFRVCNTDVEILRRVLNGQKNYKFAIANDVSKIEVDVEFDSVEGGYISFDTQILSSDGSIDSDKESCYFGTVQNKDETLFALWADGEYERIYFTIDFGESPYITVYNLNKNTTVVYEKEETFLDNFR